MTDDPKTADEPRLLDPKDFAAYDRCLDEGRRAYLAGMGIDANLYHLGTDKWEWWREGYHQ